MSERTIEDVPAKFSPYRFFVGPKGLAGYTSRSDKNDWYYSFYCKPTGKGARAGTATTFKYVERLTAKRRSRKKCIDRSYNLAMGKPIGAGIKKPPIPKGQPGVGFCMKEKRRVVIQNPEMVQAKNGRVMIQGQCPDCGTLIQKYGKLLQCPECGNLAEAASDDYICKECRAKQ